MCVHCLNHGEHGGRRGRGNCGGRSVHRLKLDLRDSKDFQEWSTVLTETAFYGITEIFT